MLCIATHSDNTMPCFVYLQPCLKNRHPKTGACSWLLFFWVFLRLQTFRESTPRMHDTTCKTPFQKYHYLLLHFSLFRSGCVASPLYANNSLTAKAATPSMKKKKRFEHQTNATVVRIILYANSVHVKWLLSAIMLLNLLCSGLLQYVPNMLFSHSSR